MEQKEKRNITLKKCDNYNNNQILKQSISPNDRGLKHSKYELTFNI